MSPDSCVPRFRFLADHLGTVRDVVDSDGGLLNHVSYDTFGNVLSQTDADEQPRFAFAGRELDAESGLYYNRLRYYDPGTGRFISEDPISFAGGDGNLYRYVGNSPLNFTDPMGLQDPDTLTPQLQHLDDYAHFKTGGRLSKDAGSSDNSQGQTVHTSDLDTPPDPSSWDKADQLVRRLGTAIDVYFVTPTLDALNQGALAAKVAILSLWSYLAHCWTRGVPGGGFPFGTNSLVP